MARQATHKPATKRNTAADAYFDDIDDDSTEGLEALQEVQGMLAATQPRHGEAHLAEEH